MFLPWIEEDRTQSLQRFPSCPGFLHRWLLLFRETNENLLHPIFSAISLPRESESYKVSPEVQMMAELSEHTREGSRFTPWLCNAQPNAVLIHQDTCQVLL